MCLAASTMTRILDVLVRDGLVKRETDPRDRRSVLIELTEKGKGIALKLKKCTEEYLRAVFNNIPNDMQGDMVESLRILLRAIERHPSCCKQNDIRKKA